jgi:hypothetical protein
MRSGVVLVAEAGVHPGVSLLRNLKRKIGFYCIELSTDEPAAPGHPEMVFVMGGLNKNDTLLASMERYNVSSGLESVAASVGIGRETFGTCAIAGEVYVTGGRDDFGDLLSSVEKYTPSTDTWSSVSNLPEPRANHAAVAVGLAMYVLGGECQRNDYAYVTTSVRKHDSAQGIWSEVAPMPEPRCDFAACAVGKDIYVFGGCVIQNDYSIIEPSVFKYDTETDEWSMLAPMLEREHGHSANELNGLVYIMGAGYGSEFMCFDPASGVWSSLARLLHEHYHGASFVLGGCLYAAGGIEINSNMERYDVAEDTWTEVTNMLEGRDHFGAITINSAGPAEERDLFDSLIVKACK